MWNLSPELLAAQRSPSTEPALLVTVSGVRAGVPRARYVRLHQDTGGPYPHDATATTQGTLVRARVSGGTLQVQRVPNAGPGSSFTSWTGLGPAAAVDPAVSAIGPARVVVVSVQVDGTTVVVRESTDDGITFGAPATAATESAPVRYVGVTVAPNGDLFLAYVVGTTVKVRRRTAGVWGAVTPWPYTAASITGFSVVALVDHHLFVTGTDSAGAHVWAVTYGGGLSVPANTWGSRLAVATASPGSAVSYGKVGAAMYDVLRAAWVEEYTGSGAYSRLLLSHQPALIVDLVPYWLEPEPTEVDPSSTPSLFASAAGQWLANGSEVWLSAAEEDLTIPQEDVLEAVAVEDSAGGRLRLVARNDHGRYDAGTADGDRLVPGAQVSVQFGYRTPAGPQYGVGPAYWLHTVTRSTKGGRATVVLEGHDGWGMLASWFARQQLRWEQGSSSVYEIASTLNGRAGLRTTVAANSLELITRRPAFTVYPGERGDVALRRLLATVPDRMRFSGDEAVLKNPDPMEAPSYTYGVEHPILEASHRTQAAQWNAVQVFGAGVLGEAFQHDSIAASGLRLRQVHDLTITTAADAAGRAASVLEEAARAGGLHEITVVPNVGQELHDVVTLAGNPDLSRRVAAITWEYRPGRGQYRQRLRLELP